MIAEFKEANKAKHEEIKNKAKEVQQEIRALVETEATLGSLVKITNFNFKRDGKFRLSFFGADFNAYRIMIVFPLRMIRQKLNFGIVY